MFEPKAWFRAIVADDVPVGFVMLSVDPEKPEYDLWLAKWLKQFLEGGREALARGGNAVSLASRRETELASQVDDLTTALGEAYVGLRVWRKRRRSTRVSKSSS